VHKAIDEHFPNAQAPSKRFSKTVFGDVPEDTAKNLLPPPSPKAASAAKSAAKISDLPVTRDKVSLRNPPPEPPITPPVPKQKVKDPPPHSFMSNIDPKGLEISQQPSSSGNTLSGLKEIGPPKSRVLRFVLLLFLLFILGVLAAVWVSENLLKGAY